MTASPDTAANDELDNFQMHLQLYGPGGDSLLVTVPIMAGGEPVVLIDRDDEPGGMFRIRSNVDAETLQAVLELLAQGVQQHIDTKGASQ